MTDVLKASAKNSIVRSTNLPLEDDGVTEVSGSTCLAEALLDVLDTDNELDAVYIITDGYENAPAGRTHEVISKLRKMGIDIPIFQVTPVMASETAGVRSISSYVSPMPVTRPEGIALASVRALIEQGQLEQGISGLMQVAIPRLENNNG